MKDKLASPAERTTATDGSAAHSDPWRTYCVRVRQVVQETRDVFTLELDFEDPQQAEAFEFEPGQFNMLYVPLLGEVAISIAGTSGRRGLRHTVRAVGEVTRYLSGLTAGKTLGLRGPFGNPWPFASLARGDFQHIIVAAGGIGIAPLRDLIERLVALPPPATRLSLFIGARSPADIVYRDQLLEWRAVGLDVQLSVDRADPGWREQVGVLTPMLDRMPIPSPVQTCVLTCGPEVMMRFVAKTALDKGIPPDNLWLTLERNMNCAIGHCGHCQLGPHFICRDGPVLRYAQACDWLKVQDL